MNINKIKAIAESYTKNFSLTEDNNSFILKLDEKFHKNFRSEIDKAMGLFINETKTQNLTCKSKHNIIIIPKNTSLNESEYDGKDVDFNKPSVTNISEKNIETKDDETKKPRYWSSKFWSDKSVSELLGEVIEPESIDVTSLPMKDELNPLIWDEEQHMHEEVRKFLLKNVLEFIKYSNLEDVEYKDIILTGSIANFNWSEHSDLDIHILFDFGQISSDREFVSDYFREKKRNWNQKIEEVRVKGLPVELYAQDTSEDHSSTGIYSIFNNEWSSKPQKTMINLDMPSIQLKASDYMNEIDELLNIQDPEVANLEADKLMDRLGEYRKSGLQSEGEYSVENLVFKLLRRSGYLEKISEIKKNNLTQDLTLENLSEGGLKDKLKKGTVGLGMVVALLAADYTSNDLKDAGIADEIINQAKEWIDSGVKAYFGK